MKGVNKEFWKYSLIILFGGFLFLAVIIALLIYCQLAAVAIIAGIFGVWWYAMHTAPMYPDDYDSPEIKRN